MFSSRLQRAHAAAGEERARESLTEKAARLRSQGVTLLDLTVSNPAQVGLAHEAEQLAAALASEGLQRYEPVPLGDWRARACLAERATAFTGEPVEAERVVMTTSTSESYAWLFKLLCDAGDGVLVPCPSYPLFGYLAALENVEVQSYPLHYAEGWMVDFGALEARIHERTRAVVVVHPNNPTGSLLRREEWERMRALCARHGLALLSDEVFARYRFGAAAGQELASLGGFALEGASGAEGCLTFCLDGLSKQAAMPQMKAGWMTVSGPGAEEAVAQLEWIADTYLSVGAPVQLALPKLLELGDGLRPKIQARLESNYARAREAGALPCEGGWTAVVPLPRGVAEEKLTERLLTEGQTLVQPGYFYDFQRGGHVVVSLLTEPEEFREGLGRLTEMVRQMQG